MCDGWDLWYLFYGRSRWSWRRDAYEGKIASGADNFVAPSPRGE
jgi:hypothetical protein